MFKKNRLSSSIAMLAALGMSHAYAQQSDTDEANNNVMLEEVVVQGVRASVISAQAIKRNAQQVVDSIVAEDIGKLPDNSVAEALQRVTGVQITRMNGEASGVMVRGLPNVVTTLNDRNIFTTTGRGVALADIPADLLKRVDVKKTASANDIEGGIAGAIDVRLRRPLDFDDGFTIAGGLRGVYSEQAKSTDPVGSLTVNNNWATDAGEFGAMLSMSYQDRGFMDQVNFNVAPTGVELGVPNIDPLDRPEGVRGPVAPNVVGEPSLVPDVIGQYFRYGDRNRTSLNGAFQWRPSETAEYYAEVFHVSYEQDSELNFWVPLPVWGKPNGYVSEYKPGTNVAKEFVHLNNYPGTITSNQAFENSSDTTQVAIGGNWDLGNLTVTTDLAYTESEAEHRSFILDLIFFAPTIVYDFSKNGSGASDVTIFDEDGNRFDLSNTDHYTLNQFFDQRSRQKGEEVAWKTDLNYDLGDGIISSVDFGMRLSQRSAFNQSADTGGSPNLTGEPVPLNDFPGMESMTPDGFLSDVVDLNTTQWLTPERDYLLNNRGDIRVAMGYEDELPEYIPEQFFDNEENNYAAYAKANYEMELGNMLLDGQFGARLVQLDYTLQGTTVVDGAPEATTIDETDNEILPSASARLQITDDLQARAAFSKTVSRPAFADLNPSTAYFLPTSTSTDGYGSGGNPNLDSIESTNIDLSLEWYFTQSGSLTAGLFSRDIDGYIHHYSSEEVVNGVTYNIVRPHSTGKGSLEGVELAYTQFFDMLPGFLSGFGIQANATFMDGDTQSPPDDDGVRETEPLANVSDESYNLILLYELDMVSARIAYNWRSDYYAGFDQAGDQPGNALVVKDSDSLDMAFNFHLNDNLTFSLEATNLTDSVYGDYFGGDSAADEYLYPRDTYARERTYSAGVRFNF